MRERLELITADSVVYSFTTGARRYILNTGGFGMPPVNYRTQRHVNQQGETLKSFNLTPRTLQIGLSTAFCTRADMFDGVADLISVLNPFRGAAELRLYAAGNIWAIDVYYSAGFELSSDDQPAPNWQGGVLRLTAYNPTWRKITNFGAAYEGTECTASLVIDAGLIFPFQFPFAFGNTITQILDCAGGGGTGGLINAGHLDAKPTIEIRGPVETPLVRNITLADSPVELVLDTTIAAGQTATIYTDWDALWVEGPGGANWTGYLTEDSSLVDFVIYAAPTAADGVNYILVSGEGAGSDTRISIKYWERYLGIGCPR